jgi:peptidoglycan/LPS O-acetylase OafA/YrhL
MGKELFVPTYWPRHTWAMMVGQKPGHAGDRRRFSQALREWMPKSSTGRHFDVLDGLRGLAIVLVVITHGFYVNPEGPKFLTYVGALILTAGFGLPIFFVLSGFLISLPFFRQRERDRLAWCPPGYAARRVLKILPPFYLAIVVLALFYYWRYRDADYFRLGLAWATGVAHVLYLPKFFNTSFWSLWVEIGFYVLLPILFLALKGFNVKTTGWILFVILILAPFVTRQLTRPAGADPDELAFIMRRFPNSLDTFGWGVLFSSLYVSASPELAQWRRYASLGYAGLTALAFTCLFFMIIYLHPGLVPPRWEIELNHLLPGVSAFLMLFFVFNPACLGARLFSLPALRFLGIVSYEWFLFHQPALIQFREWMVSSHGNLIRYSMTVGTPLVFTLGLAILVYHNFSLPILRWGRDRLR